MTKPMYVLINPQIQGNVDTRCYSNSPFGAMQKIFKNISPYFSTQYPLHPFYMTIYNVKDNTVHHYYVQDENQYDDEGIKFVIHEIPIPKNLSGGDKQTLDTLTKRLIDAYGSDKSVVQSGGKPKNRKESEESSSDSDSDDDDKMSVQKFLGIGRHANSIISKFTYYIFPYSILVPVAQPVFVAPVLTEVLQPKVMVTYDYSFVPFWK